MADFLQYVVSQVKNKSLSKSEAVSLLRQFEERKHSSRNCALHPLLHRNTSDLYEQRFSSTFERQEHFIADFVVSDQRLLPGVALLEMARAAVIQAAGVEIEKAQENSRAYICLKNIVWASPLAVGEQAVTVHIGLYPGDSLSGGGSTNLSYEIYGKPKEVSADTIVYSQGWAMLNPTVPVVSVLHLDDLRAQCSRNQITAQQCYKAFREKDIEYGPSYQCIENIFIGDSQVLAKLSLPASAAETRNFPAIGTHGYVLNPSLFEATLQASIGLTMGLENYETCTAKLVFPSSLDELQILNPCPTNTWVWIKYSSGHTMDENEPKLDIVICDDTGKVCVRILGLTLHAPTEIAAPVSFAQAPSTVPDFTPEETFKLMTFTECWEEKPLVMPSNVTVNTLLCFASNLETQQKIIEFSQEKNPNIRVIFISQTETNALNEGSPSPQNVYVVNYKNRSSYDNAFLTVQETVDKLDAIFYLWSLEDKNCIKDYTGIVHALQALAASKLSCRKFLLAGQWFAASGSPVDSKDDLDGCYLESWIGFERSLGLVLPETQLSAIYRIIDVDKQVNVKQWMQTLWAELQSGTTQSALYHAGKRYECQVTPCELSLVETSDIENKSPEPEVSSVALRAGGTYLITGGCGGLGLLFATHLAKEYSANLILTGRSPLDEGNRKKLQKLEVLGSQVEYVRADVSDLESMAASIKAAKSLFGTIHGIIHAAGIENSKTVLEKDIDDFNTVLSPKIAGSLVLDEILKDESLDFVCYFSSSSAILGDFGNCDYAVGNRFLMAYAQYRDQRTKEGKAHGKSLVINWPLWRDGGMGGEEGFSTMYLQSSGQRFLEAKEGIEIFEQLLQQNTLQHLVLVGRPSRLMGFLGLTQASAVVEPTFSSLPASDIAIAGKGWRTELKGFTLPQCIEWDLKDLASNLLKIPRDRLQSEDNLAEFGFDSIKLAEFARILSAHYDLKITPALFFGHPTLQQLTEYFGEQHADAMQTFYREESKTLPAVDKVQKTPVIKDIFKRHNRSKNRFSVVNTKAPVVDEPIAIIGMSGRFPQARTVDEMWKILVEGKDAVTEIPPDRFDWRRYYGNPQEGKTNCKWCGSLPDVAEFDPLFFEISPREATTMDPRQRLLLQESWKALEDAGYGATQISMQKIGMFVGVETGDYGILATLSCEDTGGVTDNHEGILAARLSYVLNLSGPNMAINTACSSGLVAAHQACLSLRAGECDTAIAAGVNMLFRPESFIAMSQAGMLSEDGKCYTFDQRANGMVPGEAVAVVVFKRLSQAEVDGDAIYAVIAGSGVNYDGKTNGITAPSGVAQMRLLKDVYDHYHVDPERIEYIVTHGTGTKLGDPIEINALYDAFKGYTKKQGYCALTSTKTNFGHSFAASGLVSLINLIQAMRHEIIPPSLNCVQENDYINWGESPFYVNKTARTWPAHKNKQRLGAVSAFGMSGTNAHMIVRSYEPVVHASTNNQPVCDTPYYLLALSAKTAEVLQGKIDDLVTWLQEPNNKDKPLSSVSYTLLEGRQHFSHRCAVVVQDKDDAVHALQKIGGNERLPNICQGVVSRNFDCKKALQQCAYELIENSNSKRKDKHRYQEALLALADLYCQGYQLSWKQLFIGSERHCVRLPTYPFIKEMYWIGSNDKEAKVEKAEGNLDKLHPLLHRNTSTLFEQRFSTTFSGKEVFLIDHVIGGKMVLLGVAYLEMAREAVTRAMEINKNNKAISVQLSNVVWAQPIEFKKVPATIHIRINLKDDNDIDYEIYSKSDYIDSTGGEIDTVVHGQGQATLVQSMSAPVLDLHALREICNKIRLNSQQHYETFAEIGFTWGPSLKCIETVWIGNNEVLAKLSLPETADSIQDFFLHPSLMDSSLQAGLAVSLDNYTSQKLLLPFALDKLCIYHPCTTSMWAYVRHSQGSSSDKIVQRMDVDICDDSGRVCVQIKGFTSREMKGYFSQTTASSCLMLQPYWQEKKIKTQIRPPEFAEHHVVLCEPSTEWRSQLNEKLCNQINDIRCLSLDFDRPEIDLRYINYTTQVLKHLRAIMRSKPKIFILIQIVIPYSSIEEEKIILSGLSGLLKTAQQENQKIIGQLIEVDAGSTPDSVVNQLLENRNAPTHHTIRYRNGKRWLTGWREVEFSTVQKENTIEFPWKDKGVYLITGGVGGIGLLLANDIVQKAKSTILVLAGRSPLNESKLAQIKDLENKGATVDYRQLDVANKAEVVALIDGLQSQYGQLNGIVHSAGVIRDSFILKKTQEEIQQVLAPKVTGLINLDHATQSIPLDFLVLFSSLSGVLGNVGQADYAAANTFMDAYASYRNKLVTKGQRNGRTVSIDWPLWKDGAMRMDAQSERVMQTSTGMVAMATETGLLAFYRAVSLDADQYLVMEGNLKRMRLFIENSSQYDDTQLNPSIVTNLTKSEYLAQEAKKDNPSASPATASASRTASSIQREDVANYLGRLLSPAIGLPAQRINADEPLEKYGIDSIMVVKLTNELEKTFGSLPKTLFFEYQTISELSDYFLEFYSDNLINLLKQNEHAQEPKGKSINIDSLANIASISENMREIPEERATDYLKGLLSPVIGMPVQQINADEPLEKYGINSIMVVKLTNELEKSFGSLPKTLFFEYQTISELSDYFIEYHVNQIKSLLKLNEGDEEKKAKDSETLPLPILNSSFRRKNQHQYFSLNFNVDKHKHNSEGIAIIGLSGRYPMADDLEEFWENLREGRDCITEIPVDRWDHSLYFDNEKGKPGKTYSKWGGYINDIDKFDPLYFNISPREAELMDPMERLFLQCAIHTIQDAGYTAESLEQGNDKESFFGVGVYVGVGVEEYHLIGIEETQRNNPISIVDVPAAVANRVSYFCNFSGPSLGVDTMCSSSLTAIHLACQGLYNNECNVAIAGGVNISIHPNKYLFLGERNFVSSKGFCQSFGMGGDGYVPAEGVGAVLLKPFDRAVVDGDYIYGIIKGSCINHGGRTNGYTVPNPNAQANVIKRAFENAGINPRTISYLEAHGTGTSLGDPIEIAGLSKSFKGSSKDTQFCAIGSVKSNIGHGEAAAGIAGLTKVLLQMKHKQLVPSLHSETLNPNINFETSPFVVQQKLTDWEQPEVEIDGVIKCYPRIAGISSFGAGGSNAHIVVEEYVSEDSEQNIEDRESKIIVLSDKNDERLREQVERLLRSLEQGDFTDRDLRSIAYTLQVGREAMEERIAIVTDSIAALMEKLHSYQAGAQYIENVYQGRVKENKKILAIFSSDETFQDGLVTWMHQRQYIKLAELWAKGLSIDWSQLYGSNRPHRVRLPTYPFAKERYWVPISTEQQANNSFLTSSRVHHFDNKFYEKILDDAINRKISSGTAIK